MNECLLAVSVIFLSLWIREYRKGRKREQDYAYMNARLKEITDSQAWGYLLFPTEDRIVRETAVRVNRLLEKMYGLQETYRKKEHEIYQIFTNISHDLRTPVTVLKGYVDMVYLQSRKEYCSDSLQTSIEKMNVNTEELVRAVENLLGLAKIRSGDMILEIERVNVTQICREVLLEFYDLLEKMEFQVDIHMGEKPVYAMADTEALRRILKNLIDNVTKHAGAGKYLKLSLQEQENKVCLQVEDHGAGISKEQRAHIFDRAYTGNRKTGNGLGLAISRELTGLMGAALTAESLPFEKTIFTLQLKS